MDRRGSTPYCYMDPAPHAMRPVPIINYIVTKPSQTEDDERQEEVECDEVGDCEPAIVSGRAAEQLGETHRHATQRRHRVPDHDALQLHTHVDSYVNTLGEVTSHNLWSQCGRHFVGIT